MNSNRQGTCILIFIFLIFCSVISKAQTTESVLEEFEKANEIRFTDYNRSLVILDQCYKDFITLKDTLNAVKMLRRKAYINGHHAKYKLSYDCLWKALSLASSSGNKKMVASIYIDIGRYYGFYKREKAAFDFVNKSININKELINKEQEKPSILVESYNSMCALSREFKDFKAAKQYLDSCFLYVDESTSNLIPELRFEEAVILANTGKVNQSIKLFDEVHEKFLSQNPSYNVLVLAHQGLAYQENGQLDHAEKNYRKALEVSETYDSHRDFANLIHEYLSNVYFMKGNLPLAYEELKKVKELDELFFDSRSENNRSLLEIQDQFRVEQERAEALIQKQKLSELESAEEILFLQRTILIIALGSLITLAFLFFKYIRNKYETEKRIVKQNQELKIQKTNELLELKNREMAVSALKVIEKEEIIDELKSNLEKTDWKIEPNKLKRAVKSLEVNHNQSWEEFETRFVAINSQFYKNLHTEFPDLTAGDDKLCALIKLNFNSKDMSKLLGISIESIHTTRYRLRKKLGLERDDNLTDFIMKF